MGECSSAFFVVDDSMLKHNSTMSNTLTQYMTPYIMYMFVPRMNDESLLRLYKSLLPLSNQIGT